MLTLSMRTAATRWYVPILIALGALSLQPWHWTPPADLPGLGVLLVLFICSEIFIIRFRGGATNLSFPMVFAAYILHGAIPAAVVAAVGIYAANLVRKRPQRAALTNFGFYALGATAAGWVTDSLVSPGPGDPLWLQVLGLLVYSQVYFWTIVLLLDTLIWLRYGPPTRAQWLSKTKLQLAALGIATGYSALFLASGPRENLFQLALLFFPLFIIGSLWQTSHSLRRSQQRHAFLSEMAARFTAADTLSSVAHVALTRLHEVVPFQQGAIFLRMAPHKHLGTEALRTVAVKSPVITDPIKVWRVRGGPVERALRTGEPQRIDDLAREKEWRPPRRLGQVKSCILVPVSYEGTVRGLIALSSDVTYTFHPEDVQLLTVLVNQLTGVMRNQEVVEHRERLVLTQERNRLAREIHDGLAQQLAGILLRMEHFDRIDPPLDTQIGMELGSIRHSLREALREVRRSIYDLRPQPLEGQSFIPAIRRLVQDFARDTGLQTGLEALGEPRGLDSRVENALFQICNEALVNIRKHAEAREVSIQLRFTRKAVRLVVSDDGKGFELLRALHSAGKGYHMGIIGMHERVKEIGGRLAIDSTPGTGTRVDVEVPLGRAETPQERVG